MIHAKDLRTSNLIYRLGNVSEVDWSTIKLCAQRNKQFNEDWKPIPLTPEWLERFGAIFPYGDHRGQIGNSCFMYNENGLNFTDSGWNEAVSYPIKMVHKFQNAFYSLEEKELNITQ